MLFDYEFRDSPFLIGELALRLRAAARFDRHEDGKTPLPFGSTLWPAAVVLAEALVREPGLVQGQAVLELGAGLGLVSVVAAKLGASVTASDGHPDMDELLAHNAKSNDVSLRYVSYDWGKTAPPEKSAVVLASDVLYEPAACTLLADALLQVLAPGGIALIADPGRPHWPRFLKKLEARGFIHDDARVRITSQVPLLEWHPTAKRAHHLLRVRWA